MKKYTSKFLTNFFYYHAVPLQQADLNSFEKLYHQTLAGRKAVFYEYVMKLACERFDANFEELQNGVNTKNANTAKQIGFYVMEKLGYQNKDLAELTDYTPARISKILLLYIY